MTRLNRDAAELVERTRRHGGPTPAERDRVRRKLLRRAAGIGAAAGTTAAASTAAASTGAAASSTSTAGAAAGATAAASTATSTAGAATASTVAAWKIGVTVAGLVAATAGGYAAVTATTGDDAGPATPTHQAPAAHRAQDDAPASPASSGATPPAVVPEPEVPEAPPSPGVAPAVAPDPRLRHARSQAQPADPIDPQARTIESADLRAQIALLSEAVQAIGAGQRERALELLDEHARLYPDSPLARERAKARERALHAGEQP